MDVTVRELYDKERSDEASDIWLHLPTFVALADEMMAKRVVELGVRRGASTVAWLYAMERTAGHLWSVDTADPPLIDHLQWTFIQGNDTQIRTVDQTPESADICFIDTSHDYEHTRLELSYYGGRVRPGGVILLHDTMVERPDDAAPDGPPFPVRRAIEWYCDFIGYTWTDDQRCNGLATIEVPA